MRGVPVVVVYGGPGVLGGGCVTGRQWAGGGRPQMFPLGLSLPWGTAVVSLPPEGTQSGRLWSEGILRSTRFQPPATRRAPPARSGCSEPPPDLACSTSGMGQPVPGPRRPLGGKENSYVQLLKLTKSLYQVSSSLMPFICCFLVLFWSKPRIIVPKLHKKP